MPVLRLDNLHNARSSSLASSLDSSRQVSPKAFVSYPYNIQVLLRVTSSRPGSLKFINFPKMTNVQRLVIGAFVASA